jgi:thiol-disulfide isomerase/thioredoxin
MKKPFYLLLILIFLTSCKKKETENPTRNISEINLMLLDYNPEKHKKYIDIKIENLISPIEEQLKISDDGIVNYVFINKEKKEIILDYDSRMFSLIIDPNEKVNVELNVSELLNWSRFKKFKITGNNKATNALIIASTFYLDSLIRQSTNPFVRDSALNNVSYKNKRVSEMKNHLQIFNNYNSTNKIKNLTFIDWGKAQIRYKAGRDLNYYIVRRINPNKNINDENPYFTFINDIKFNSNDELIYHSYLEYIEDLTGSYNLIGNWANKYKEKRKVLRRDYPTGYFLKLELLKKLPKGKDRELMMAYIFKNEQRLFNHTGKKMPTKYIDSLKYYTNKKLISQLNQKNEINTTSIKLLIEDYDISQKEKEELLKIYDKTEGKVVFHDFWATWCAPCMKELPNYNDFMEIAGEDVVFVMFGVHMDEKEWNKAREKLNLKGNHYLLTHNQLAFYEKYFKVSSFPHHQIINKKGQIVKEEIPKVNPLNYERLFELIEKHKF